MNALEAIALRRAEEQITSGAWRTKDPGEGRFVAPRLCQVPGCWNPITPGPGTRTMCDACRAKGRAATPCKGCGGAIRRIDQKSVAKERRGYCQACRAEWPRRETGRENIKFAQAAANRRTA